MSFRFGDPGGRIYTSFGAANVNVLYHWTSYTPNGAGSFVVSAGNGRLVGSCLRASVSAAGAFAVLSKTLDAQAIWGCALALRVSALGAYCIAAFDDATTAQVDLRLNGDGTLSVTRNGTVLATSSFALTSGAWHHVEIKVTIADAGSYEVWVNGVSRISGSGDTKNTANAYATVFRIGWPTNSGTTMTVDYDDIIVYDGQATDANGFSDIVGPIGDCALAWLLPTGAGMNTQFTPSAGSNYACVNEATPDGDTSYVESSTVGHTDTYAIADLPGAATAVLSVATLHLARKTDAGSRGMKSIICQSGVCSLHGAEVSLGDSYRYWWSGWGQNPAAGTPTNWTVATANSAEAGQKVSS